MRYTLALLLLCSIVLTPLVSLSQEAASAQETDTSLVVRADAGLEYYALDAGPDMGFNGAAVSTSLMLGYELAPAFIPHVMLTGTMTEVTTLFSDKGAFTASTLLFVGLITAGITTQTEWGGFASVGAGIGAATWDGPAKHELRTDPGFAWQAALGVEGDISDTWHLGIAARVHQAFLSDGADVDTIGAGLAASISYQ